MDNFFKNDVHVRGECRFVDETVLVRSDADEVFPVEVPVVSLEVLNHLTAVVDCGLDEALSRSDDDCLLKSHGVPPSRLGLLIWNCSPFQTCVQVVRPGSDFLCLWGLLHAPPSARA